MSKIILPGFEIIDDSQGGSINIKSLSTSEEVQLKDNGDIDSSVGLDAEKFNGGTQSDFVKLSPSFSVGVDFTAGPEPNEAGAFQRQFIGSTLLPPPDGRVVFTPHESGNVGLFDPSDETYTSGPAHNEGSAAFGGSVLAPDGRVVFQPANSANIGIFDPSDDSYTSGPAYGSGSSPNDSNAPTRLKDGRIIFNDDANGDGDLVIKIFDYTDDSLTNGPSVTDEFWKTIGRVPDGRVFYAAGDTYVGIFDPTDDSFTTQEVDFSNASTFSVVSPRAGVVLPDGQLLLIPITPTAPFSKLDPETLEITELTATPKDNLPPEESNGANGEFIDGQVLPDGRIFLVPLKSEVTAIYDPVRDETVPGPKVKPYQNTTQYYGSSTILQDGRVILTPAVRDSVDVVYQPLSNVLSNSGNY